MSTGTRNAAAWVGAGLVAIGMAGGMALFAARSAAATEVRPVSERVTRLEAQQEDVARRLERMDAKLDRILERAK